jgi:hypothetical protein
VDPATRNAYDDRLLVSADRGRSWNDLERPGPLVDLAVDPSNERRIVATTEEGLFESRDGGEGWTRLGEGVGVLAWPKRERLYLAFGFAGLGAFLRSQGRRPLLLRLEEETRARHVLCDRAEQACGPTTRDSRGMPTRAVAYVGERARKRSSSALEPEQTSGLLGRSSCLRGFPAPARAVRGFQDDSHAGCMRDEKKPAVVYAKPDNKRC